jgi:hypothetical protein
MFGSLRCRASSFSILSLLLYRGRQDADRPTHRRRRPNRRHARQERVGASPKPAELHRARPGRGALEALARVLHRYLSDRQMNKHLFQSATFFLCILVLSFAPCARSQGQTNPVPQAGANPAKEQLNPEEPEANTSASAEALQKATENPVASLISVPVQKQYQFWCESRLSNTGRFGYSARDTNRHFEGLEPAPSVDYADRLATRAQSTVNS